MILSIICMFSIAVVIIRSKPYVLIHNGIIAMNTTAALLDSIYKAFVFSAPLLVLTAPIEKSSPKTALPKVIKAVR